MSPPLDLNDLETKQEHFISTPPLTGSNSDCIHFNGGGERQPAVPRLLKRPHHLQTFEVLGLFSWKLHHRELDAGWSVAWSTCRLTPAKGDYKADTLSKPAAPQRGLFSESSVNGLQTEAVESQREALNLLHDEQVWRLCGFEPSGTDSGCAGQLKTFRGPIFYFSQDGDRWWAKSSL